MAEDSDNALRLPQVGSIPAPVLINPLSAMNQGLQTAGHMWDVQGARAKEAAGQAFLSSIDPNTGQPNQALLMQNLRKDPNTALAAQSSAQSGVTLDTDTQALKMKRLTGLNAAAVALTAQYPDGVPKAVIDAEIDRIGPQYGLTPQQIAESKQAFGEDRVANSRTIIRNSISNLNAQDALHAALPERKPLNVGGAVVYPDVNPVTNPAGPGTIGTTLTPETLASKITYNDPETNQPKTTTFEEFLRANNIPIPGGGGTPGGAAPGGSGGGGGPSGAGAPSTTNQPRLNPPSQPASTGPRGGATGPNPDMVAKWKASTDQYTADNAEAGNYQQRTFPLAQAAALLQRGNVTTGEGAEAINRAKSFLQTRLATFGLDAQTVSNSEGQELGKYMTQYVNQQGFSQKSDAALASAISGNPSMHLNTMTNKDVIAAMAGMERMKQMMLTDFKNQGGEGRTRDWADFKAKWQNEHDPRAFVVDFLDGPRRQKLLASMTPEQRKSFDKTLTLVEQNPGIMGLAAMPGH